MKKTLFTMLFLCLLFLASCAGREEPGKTTDSASEPAESTAGSETVPGTESPVTEPPETEVPDTLPPETEPPVTEAPETVPPETEPVMTEPPETEPPELPVEFAPAPEAVTPGSTVTTYPYAIVPPLTENPADPLGPVKVDMEKYFSDVILHQTENAGDGYLDNIIFLGDSRTYGVKLYNQWYHFLKDGLDTRQVWTPKNGTITLFDVLERRECWIVYPEDGTEISLTECVRRKHPQTMFINLGINGVGYMSETEFKREYGEIIEMILTESPETKIILAGMMPVTASFPYNPALGVCNYSIARGNVMVAQLAQVYGVKYLDLYECFADETGNLPEKYNGGDGLHLSGDAYVKMMEYIVTHAYQ